MRADIQDSVRRVAAGINTVELRNATSIETSVRLMQDILDTRRKLGKAPTYAAASITSLASATLRFAEGMEHLATCHQELSTLKNEGELVTIAYGDICPVEGSAAPLRRVA